MKAHLHFATCPTWSSPSDESRSFGLHGAPVRTLVFTHWARGALCLWTPGNIYAYTNVCLILGRRSPAGLTNFQVSYAMCTAKKSCKSWQKPITTVVGGDSNVMSNVNDGIVGDNVRMSM